ncbi:MAG: TIGR02221 family CRISPR-associated protein, partial [Balneolia bacterium]|nr:TIGR02221 family CRISPR-associated protein [Balneolia bacterium]
IQPRKINQRTTMGYSKPSSTRFVQSAIRKHFEPGEHYVFVTKAAREKHGSALIREGFEEREFVDVDEGKSTEEMWGMFAKISETVPSGSELVFDVTHGFRIQPMLALAVIVYLRFQKQITVKKICYGLFEEGADQNEILDITSFLEIIDWSFAIRRFTEKGDARDLADIMKKYHQQTYKGDQAYKAQKLANTGTALSELMDNLSLVRAGQVGSIANRLVGFAEDLRNDLENISQTKPLAAIMESLKIELNGLQFPDAASGNEALFTSAGMVAMINMCRYYLKVGKHQQCLTLSTELLIGAAAILHKQDPLDENIRNGVSYRLNSIEKKSLIGPEEEWEKPAATIMRLAGEARNDVNHAGIRKDPKAAKSLIGNAKRIVNDIEDFLIAHKLIPDSRGLELS